MADYTSKAQIVLTVNGKQAEKIFKDLEKQAEKIKKKIASAAKIGDKDTVKKLTRDLKAVERQINQIKGASQDVEATLRSLDKASPKELNKALSQLKRELEGIEKGSDAWKAHMQKIKSVKAEIQRLNNEMGQQKSRWQKMNDWLNNTQTFIMGLAAAVTGLVMAGRKAVNAYAEMDEQLANTRKYTGMTEKDVLKLNDAFKKMDTRTARDKLNELAQEGGRLGKNTIESVKGYTEAADIINVALVDLGSGATQTIAKLANIFGVEKMLGTKKAMLSIGSAVNVLSQNCTASKPYLVEFAQRMAGIGSQAGLTVPQILAFGAVLDANGQKVEMSATAIQKVIMNLANKNQEFAKVVGLDADKLNKTLKHSAKDGLLMFLEALQKIGKSAGFENATLSIAPAFKEMGLDAARVSQVLSTLAMHLDEVKWQMGEADKAFREASSATKEYEIFNNTAQAAIDKAKARVRELAIELGEKLYPVMKHIYTSSGIFMRVLNAMVDFIIKNRSEILALCSAFITFGVVMNLARIRTLAFNTATVLGNAAMATWTTITKGASLAVALLTGNFEKARTSWIALNTAFKASVIGLAIAAITLVVAKFTSGIIEARRRTAEYKKSMDDAMSSATSFAESAQSEVKEIDKLIGVLKSAKKESKEYQDAKDAIISKYGIYLKGIVDETGEITNLALAYDRLTWAANKSAQARGIANAKESLSNEYFQNLDKETERLRSALEAMGMDDINLSRIITSVSQSLATNLPVSKDIQKDVMDFQVRNSGKLYNMFGIRNDIEAPVKILESLESNRMDFIQRNDKLSRMDNRYFGKMDSSELERQIESLQKAIETGPLEKFEIELSFPDQKSADRIIEMLDRPEKVTEQKEKTSEGEKTSKGLKPKKASEAFNEYVEVGKIVHTMELTSDSSGSYIAKGTLTRSDAEELMRELLYERKARGGSSDESGKSDGYGKQYSFNSDDSGSDKKEDKFAKEKEWKEKMEALNRIAYATGKKDYIAYTKEMDRIEVEYQKKRLKHDDLDKTERLTIRAEYYEAVKKRDERFKAETLEKEESLHNEQVSSIKSMYISNLIDKEKYDDLMQKEEMKHQYAILHHCEKGSKEYLAAKEKLKDMEIADMNKRLKETEALEKKYAEVKAEHFGDNPQERQAKLDAEMDMLKIVYEREIQAAENNASEKLRIEEAFEKAKLALRKKYGLLAETEQMNSMEAGVSKSVEWLNSDGGKALTGAMSTLSSGMSSIFSQVTELVQNELAIQTAAIEKRYEKELSKAEGNSYMVAQLEKQKEAEIAKAKNEANRKMYGMQVMQAIAQTATGAINAYSSAAAVPVVGYILAPIAAAAAVAAGMMQVANIKKQQEASAASGYAEGGFTEEGDKYKPVGIVHAGEWVASQRLVRNPRIRPILNTLEYAQRNNVEPTMSMADVSMRLTAPTMIAQSLSGESEPSKLMKSLDRLNKRLNDPFVTVATIAGDKGIEREQKRYDRLMKNKS